MILGGKIMSSINTRPIFSYDCITCGNERKTLVYERAVTGQCMKCKRKKIPNPNQLNLFGKGENVSKRDD